LPTKPAATVAANCAKRFSSYCIAFKTHPPVLTSHNSALIFVVTEHIPAR
jgi:hypothetical protein